MERPNRAFFERYTPEVARDLLGCTLWRLADGVRHSGRIVEVEAYRGEGDPASHAYRGVTKRNSLMFGRGGMSYVYFSYGFHHCLNITTEKEGHPGAVLIRALEPLEGIGEMKRRRQTRDLTLLTNGPGKLTKALGIDLSLNGVDLVTSDLLFVTKAPAAVRVSSSPRIGINAGRERRWRFFVPGSPFLSRASSPRPRHRNA